jgi:hypothetical protein
MVVIFATLILLFFDNDDRVGASLLCHRRLDLKKTISYGDSRILLHSAIGCRELESPSAHSQISCKPAD